MNQVAETIVVIPAYNEAQTIRAIVVQTLKQVKQVIVVDDGSSDGTAEAVADLPVTLLRNACNCGKAASLLRGMQQALNLGAHAIITLDGDGQHQPEGITQLIAAAKNHPGSIVIGARLAEKANFPPARYFANCFANFWISWAAGCAIADSQSGFRLYPTTLLKSLQYQYNKVDGFVFESEILIDAARAGYPLITVPIAAIYSQHARASHFRPVLDISRIVMMVAWKLISKGLYLQGLYRSLIPAAKRTTDYASQQGG